MERGRDGYPGRPAAPDLHLLPPCARDWRRRWPSPCARWAASRRAEIAAAFLIPEPTSRSGSCAPSGRSATPAIPYRVPPRAPAAGAAPRGVLAVLYLIFNEGYAATAGALVRTDLCDEAIRLTRVLARLMPDEPEVARPARADAAARLAPGGAHRRRRRARPARGPGPRALGSTSGSTRAATCSSARSARGQAGRRTSCRPRSQRCTRAARPRTPTGRRSPRCTGDLAELSPSPVVELNRAVAVAMADGPDAGLALDRSPRPGARRLPPVPRGPRRPPAAARSPGGGGRRPTPARSTRATTRPNAPSWSGGSAEIG